MACTLKSQRPKARTAAVRIKPAKPDKREAADLVERNELVMENLAWARQIAAGVARKLPSWFVVDDLVGPAEIGLIRAAAAYDSATHVPFRAFAQSRVFGACIDSIRRKEYRERSHDSIDAPAMQNEPYDASGAIFRRVIRLEEVLTDSGPSPEEQATSAEMAAIAALVWERVQRLPPRHRAVIRGVYRKGLPLAEIARAADVGASRVSQIHREALELLRKICVDLKRAA